MKKIIFCLIILTVCALLAPTAHAEPPREHPPRLVDDASLLTFAEAEFILGELNRISEEQGCDVVVITVSSIGGKRPEAFSDDYFDYNGYGMGENNSGILLLINMEKRDWHISTAGNAINIFTDNLLEFIEGEILFYLSDGDYNGAFLEFANLSERFLIEAQTNGINNHNYDGYEYTPGIKQYLYAVFHGLLIAAIISLIVVLIMKSKLKSVRRKLTASDYVRRGSLNITNSAEFYLYRTVSRVAKPQNNQSTSGRSGGSSIHRSSSGRSHGGRGGKF